MVSSSYVPLRFNVAHSSPARLNWDVGTYALNWDSSTRLSSGSGTTIVVVGIVNVTVAAMLYARIVQVVTPVGGTPIWSAYSPPSRKKFPSFQLKVML